MSDIICNICGEPVKIRKTDAMGSFPSSHKRKGTNEPCHGFYVVSNNHPEKDNK